ncbi:hypothetical protein D3C75_990110 [compost metagenome]
MSKAAYSYSGRKSCLASENRYPCTYRAPAAMAFFRSCTFSTPSTSREPPICSAMMEKERSRARYPSWVTLLRRIFKSILIISGRNMAIRSRLEKPLPTSSTASRQPCCR